MLKKIIVGSISLLVFSTSNFAAVSYQSGDANSNSQAFSNALHTTKLSSLSKDDDYKFLMSVIMIGKKVEVASVKSPLYKHKGLTGSVLISQTTSNITVTITDVQGSRLSIINLGNSQGSGLKDFVWSGKLSDGTTAQPGIYNISATGIVNGATVALPTAGDFKVESVSVDRNNFVVLHLDGVGGVALDDIVKVL